MFVKKKNSFKNILDRNKYFLRPARVFHANEHERTDHVDKDEGRNQDYTKKKNLSGIHFVGTVDDKLRVINVLASLRSNVN